MQKFCSVKFSFSLIYLESIPSLESRKIYSVTGNPY